jgi:uncharacterized protein
VSTLPFTGRRNTSVRRLRAVVTAAAIILPLLLMAALVAGPGASYAPASAASPNIVISQVYGGAGCGTAGCSTYKNDYIELFNRGSSPQSLNGWSVQYAAAAGTSWQVTSLTNVTLQPGQYYLVGEGAGANGVNNIPTPDATGTIAMSATAAKVALVNTTTALSGSCPASASIVDLVGYGGTATCFETAVAPGPSTVIADFRKAAGCTDTDDNSADFTTGAPSPRNTASAFNVCGPATPTPTPTPALSINDVTQAEGDAGTTNFVFTVSLSQPANAGGVSFTVNTVDGATNPAVAGSDYVAIVNGSGSIPEGSSSTTVTVQVNGDTTTEPNETFFVNISGVTGAGVTDAQGLGTISNDDSTLTPIHDIQGAGTSSPVVGQTVATRGIVTAIKIGSGFYIQEPDATVDANPNTSEGVFVFTGSSIPAAAVVGNNVQVSGAVQEFVPSADTAQHPVTELGGAISISVLSTGNPLPTASTITAADTLVNDLDNLERFEGMRVTVPSLTVIAPTQGAITEPSATVSSNGVFHTVVTGVARPFREPGVNASDPLPPGSPANVPRFDENPERIRIDSDAQPGTTALNVSTGAVLTNVTGPLDYSFRAYTILPDTTLTGTGVGPTPAPTPTAGEFTVASFNMERFFDTVNDPNKDDAVLTQAALDKRLNKASLIVRNIQHYPDVIGVEEMENISTLQMVAAKINSDAQTIDALPNPNYVAYLVEGNDIGGIDVGFLVKESRVSTVSVEQIELAGCNHISGAGCYTYTNPNTGGQELLNDRPSLVLRATVNRPAPYGGVIPFTVIVNHLRSLSSIDDDVTPNGTGTAGSRVRAKRKAQADFLANYIQSRQTADPNEKIITVGDMNAFRINDGYVDMIGTILGTPSPDDQTVVPGDGADLVNPDQTDLIDTLPADQRYSYTFDGNAQVLDHVIVNPNAMAILNRFAYAREDADQPVSDYADGNIPDRISDHDQPIGYFSLVPTAPDLAITKVPDRNPAPVEFNFNYNITVTNTGTPASNVVVTDPLPSQVTLTAATTSQGTCFYDSFTKIVTCNLGTVNSGSTVNIQLTVKPRSEGTLDNTATVTTTDADSNPSNNSASANGVIAQKYVDLATSMSESADPIFAGENETYTVVVKNINSPVTATGVALTDTLPASMTFVSATTSQGSLVTPPVGSTGTVTANLGAIAPGATATVTITAKSTAAGTVTNSATASSNESDFSASNNTDSSTITVKSAALLKVLLAKQVLTGGCENTTGNVYLTGPAGPGGVTVSLSSTVSGASVPASVFIPEGQSVSPAFNVTTSPVATKQVGTINATLGATTVSRGITINKGSGVCAP